MVVSQEDLDNFLTIVESKLRGPFSSLDVAKAVTSTRDLAPRQYLQQVKQVFPRMDKVTKLRVLIAMLGLDPSEETDDLIYELFSAGQEERLSEEWVKVIAGLNRGIMYQDGDGSRESCRGEDAQQLLEKSCNDVLERVVKHKEHADTDPLFSPYFYSLLNADVLKEVLPECLKNPHFKVNADAAILKEDERLEQKKAQDDQSGSITRRTNAATNGKAEAKPKARDLPTMPGINKLTKARATTEAGKSSMFLPAKKNTYLSAWSAREAIQSNQEDARDRACNPDQGSSPWCTRSCGIYRNEPKVWCQSIQDENGRSSRSTRPTRGSHR